MSKNQSSVLDAYGEFSDWIEIYNAGSQPIDLDDYYLSDKSDDLKKWRLPSINLAPKAFYLIIASGRDEMVGEEAHTNFGINDAGEQLLLTHYSTGIVDQMTVPALIADTSYGSFPDGTANRNVFNTASPGFSNYENDELHFSHPSGFYAQEFDLTIEALSGHAIHYTLDGSLPDSSDPQADAALTMLNKNSDPNYLSEYVTTPPDNLISYSHWQAVESPYRKANVVRCASFKNGLRTSPIYTQTYWIGEEANNPYAYPVISLVTDEDNLFDDSIGIYVPGIHYDVDNPQWSGNYFQRGTEWERPAQLSYFEEDGTLAFEQGCGIRIHGGKTRQAAQKSLKLYARSSYGEEFFNYPLMPQSGNDQYKRFLLRTTMGSWGKDIILKDVLVHDVATPLKVDVQNYRPVVLFVNGEYWGIHTIRDRIDEWSIAEKNGIDKEEVQLFDWENDGNYWEMIEYMTDHDVSQDMHYNYISQLMDMDNFIDFMSIGIYFKNLDWPCNNVNYWRQISDTGKWKWLLKDVDAGFYDPEKDMFIYLEEQLEKPHHGGHCASYIFNILLKNEIFKEKFIQRFACLMIDYFSPEVVFAKLEKLEKLYKPGLSEHIARWNFPKSISDWEDNLEEDMVRFINERPSIIKKQFLEYFAIENESLLCSLENVTGSDLKIGPNPARDQLYLNCNRPECLVDQITIHDIMGRLVYWETEFSFVNIKELDIAYLSAGHYVITIQHATMTETIPFVVQ